MYKLILPYTIGILLIIGGYFFWGNPILKEKEELEGKVQNKLNVLQGYFRDAKNIPSPAISSAYEKGNGQLEKKYEKVRESLPVIEPLSLPGDRDPKYYFMDELERVKSKLNETAVERGFTIPEELDFPKEYSAFTEEEVPILLGKLYLVQKIINLVSGKGVSSVTELKIGDFEDGNDYKEISVTLKLQGNMLSITKLLHVLENYDKEFLLVRGLKLQSPENEKGGEQISAEFRISMLRWEKLK